MIVLRRVKQGTNIVIGEPLMGMLDGYNKVFTVPHNFKYDKIVVFFNGQELSSYFDFEVTGPNEITFIYILPETRDILNATYEVE